MKTTNEEFAAELTALESHVTVLETQMRTRGQAVPSRPDVASAKKPSATLDEIFSAMGAMESHAAKLRVTARLSTPLAYAPNATPTATTGLTTTQRIAAGGGAKAFNLKSEIAKLEALLPGTNGKTKSCLESKLASLRSELAGISPETPALKLTAAQERMAVLIVAMHGVVKNSKPNGQAAKAAQAKLEQVSAELKATGVDPDVVTANMKITTHRFVE